PDVFATGHRNLGVITGDRSGCLADVDIDILEALTVAPFYLPSTEMRHGRASKPVSHWWYRLASTGGGSVRLKAPDGATIIELRANGKDGKTLQTLCPPSIHPCGETIAWDANGKPALVEHTDLCAPYTALAQRRCWRGTRPPRAVGTICAMPL